MSPFAKTMFSSVTRARSAVVAVHTHMAVINAVGLVLVATLTVLYIAQINGAVTKGYRIRDLETRIQDLTLANQQLEVTTRRVQSLEHITTSMKMLGMVPSGTPAYMESGQPSYALAK
jgi:uncharacterized membrane protein YdbT with pleckstrin-like domain